MNPLHVTKFENPLPSDPNSQRGARSPRGRGRGRTNSNQRPRKQFCFFHGEDAGHSTGNCREALEFKARMGKDKNSHTKVVNTSSHQQYYHPHQQAQYQPYTISFPHQETPITQYMAQPLPLTPANQYASQPPQFQTVQKLALPQPSMPQPSMPKTEQPFEPANQALPSRGHINTIIGGSALDFESKRARTNHYRKVNTIATEGPIVKTKWSHMPIMFTEADLKLKDYPHTDAMVIEAHIHGWQVSKVLIDDGSQADILFLSTFDQMGLSTAQLHPADIPLYGFGGKKIEPVGRISLSVSFGTRPTPEQKASPSTWSTSPTPTMQSSPEER